MWSEIGDGVFCGRYEWVDLAIGLVVGGDGALVVDTRTTPAEGAQLRGDIAAVTGLPVRWVVNTHWHWDHVLGNGEFADGELWGHSACASHLAAEGAADVAAARKWFPPERLGELEGVLPTIPGHTFAETATIDLGGRLVTLRHRGLAHTDSDVSVTVEGTGVVFAGDMLESGAPPFFGDGFPVAWPDTLAQHLGGANVVVPGHGAVMDRQAADTQMAELRAVAVICRRVVAAGVAPEDTPEDAPYPAETMESAIARARIELG